MALKRWNGTGYEDVSLARHDGQVPTVAYVWDGSGYVRVWPERLTASGSVGETQLSNTQNWQQIASWTAPRGAVDECYVEYVLTWNGPSNSHKIRIVKNGVNLGTSPEQQGGPNLQTVATLTPVAEGDVFTFEAWTANVWVANNLVSSAEWSITE